MNEIITSSQQENDIKTIQSLLADFESYCEVQEKVIEARRDPEEWTRKSIMNTAGSGKFSSDRTIREYAQEIWNVDAMPTELHGHKIQT